MASVKSKLATARLLATRRTPYFSHALYALVPREVPNGSLMFIGGGTKETWKGTMGVTEGGLLIYEPQFIEAYSPQQLAAALIHEVNHWIRDHAKMTKRNGWDPQLANLAQDAAINDDIERMGMELPHKFLPKDIPAKDGLSEPEYYDLLRRNSTMITVTVCCGSGCGNPLPNEPKDDPGSRSPRDVENVRTIVADAIRKAPPGSVPQEMKRWAEEKQVGEKIRWEDKLAKVCRTAMAYRPGAIDLRFSRISRRQAGAGFGVGKPVLPALVSPVPEICVAFDTSGSMGPNELSIGINQTVSILKAVGARISFISCDAVVHTAGKISSPAQIASMMKGGGGTDFRPVFEKIKSFRPRPEVLVFITDGQGPAPMHNPPGLKVIWLLVGKHLRKPAPEQDYQKEISYGTFIEMK